VRPVLLEHLRDLCPARIKKAASHEVGRQEDY
jgi:hypothetical protein